MIQLHLTSTGALKIDWTKHRNIWTIFTSPWQLMSVKSSPQYSQIVARWCIQTCWNGWVIWKKQNGEKAQALGVQRLTRQNPRWTWDHLVHHCCRFGNKLWSMLLQAIRSYHQTPCRDKDLDISGVGCVYSVITNFGTRTDVQSQILSVLDQAACHRWSVPDERIEDHRIFQGS